MIKVEKILKNIDYSDFIGDKSQEINEVIQLDPDNKRKDVIFWCSAKNISLLQSIEYGTVICPVEGSNFINKNCNYIFTTQPRRVFKRIIELFFNNNIFTPGIESTAVISKSAKINNDVYIGHNVIIEDNCIIGSGTSIGHNSVLLKNTVVGSKVKIGCNNTIGGVGFGYEKNEDGVNELIPHIGNVIIKDHVEIGNNTCIDRAVLGSTLISSHVKIDNQVHVAHGVQIGENSLVIAHAMIGGSTKIGRDCWIAPSSSIINKVSIGDSSLVGLGAVVVKDVAEKAVVIGNPAKPLQKKSDG